MQTLMLKKVVLGLAAMVAVGMATQAAQAQGYKKKNTLNSSGSPEYYSYKLKAQFRIEKLYLPQVGTFRAARIVSEPRFNSPLNKLGLRPGDVITRLDGVRVDNLGELENHYDRTTVRYIRTGTQNFQEGRIYIPTSGGGVPGPGSNSPGNLP